MWYNYPIWSEKFKLPVVPANMQTVMNEKLAKWFCWKWLLYIMHRFDEEARIPLEKHMQNSGLFASISVGVKKAGIWFYRKISSRKVNPRIYYNWYCAWSPDSVINMIKHIKTHIPDSFVIAGNVGTSEGVRELENAGADATKVGIGPGRVCITKN